MNTNTILILTFPILCLAGAIVVIVIWSAPDNGGARDKEETWSAFASRIKGIYKGRSHGGPDQVAALIGNWPIYLDTYVAGVKGAAVEYTRLRAFYAMRVPFELVATNSPYDLDLIVAKHLHHVQIPLMRMKVQLMTSNADMAHRLLAADIVAPLLESVQPFDLHIRRRRNWRDTGVSSSIYEVHLQAPKVVTDLDYLMGMYALVVACLEQLQLLGCTHHSFAAYESTTTVSQSPS